MSSFIKTFLICLVLSIGYLIYVCFSNDSFSPSLKLSDNNPVFSVNKNYRDSSEDINGSQIEADEDKSENKTSEVPSAKELTKKYIHTCYFYSVNGKLIPVKREVEAPLTIENTIALLLKGPLINESKKGIYSEIPANVDLINVQRKNNNIIINLTSNFGVGGGSESVENRLKQLSKTVKTVSPNKNIYLYINGSEVEYLGGEGVYVKQPLE